VLGEAGDRPNNNLVHSNGYDDCHDDYQNDQGDDVGFDGLGLLLV